MQNMRQVFGANLNFISNISRLVPNELGQPRLSVYLSDWRSSFEALTASQLPITSAGLSVARWLMVGSFLDVTKMPAIGDAIDNLRFARTGALVKSSLTVVEVHPFPIAGMHVVFVTESKNR